MEYLSEGEKINHSKENLKKNIGERICYVTTRDVDKRRGFVFPRYGVIEKFYYSTMYLTSGTEVDMRDLLEVSIIK